MRVGTSKDDRMKSLLRRVIANDTREGQSRRTIAKNTCGYSDCVFDGFCVGFSALGLDTAFSWVVQTKAGQEVWTGDSGQGKLSNALAIGLDVHIEMERFSPHWRESTRVEGSVCI